VEDKLTNRADELLAQINAEVERGDAPADPMARIDWMLNRAAGGSDAVRAQVNAEVERGDGPADPMARIRWMISRLAEVATARGED
jgi:hypothetical protein